MKSIVTALVGAACLHATGAAAQQITVAGPRVFPESMTASKSGAVIFGSLGDGGIYRAAPGQNIATLWIDPKVSGLSAVTGVYADDRTNTLFVCSVIFPPSLPHGPEKEALRTFDLKTGAAKAAYPMPFGEKSLCNDIAVDKAGDVYVADTPAGAIHRLRKGGSALEVWIQNDRLRGADGVAVGGDGAVYVNSVSAGKLFRVTVGPDRSAGEIVELKTSLKLERPDGLRAIGGLRFLQAEGGAGRIALISVSGDVATVTPIREGQPGLTGVTLARGKVWSVNAKLAYLTDPTLKDKDPGPFTAEAVDLPR